MRVHFLGVRGSTPAPGIEFVPYGGHTSSVAIAHDGAEAPTLILDAGTGIRRCSELLDGDPFRGTILLSHLHWDHVHGLPFFSAANRVDSRVTVMIPEQFDDDRAVEVLARGMSPPHFPVRPDELTGTWSFLNLSPGEMEVEGFSVLVCEIPHKGGRTFGIRVSDAHSSIAYLPDHCPSVLGPGPEGWGEYHEAALALAEHTDLLIHDAQLVAHEHAAEASYGHTTAEYAVELGRRADSKRTVLFHHRPDRTDAMLDEMPARFDDDPRVLVATESTILEL